MPLPRSSAAQLHREIEEALAPRFTGALSPRVATEPERTATGIDALDALLGRGLPASGLSELVGEDSSGRTTIALSFLARITAQDTATAWIDVCDTFDPETAAESGVDLRRVLWVRCAEPPSVPLAADEEKRSTILSKDGSSAAPRPSHTVPRGGGRPHPRFEAHGMPDAIASLLQTQPRSGAMHDRQTRRMVGTPGAPNRPLMPFPAASPYREEQVPTDRMPARRSVAETDLKEAQQLGKTGGKQARPFCLPMPAQGLSLKRSRDPSWAALDKALRVTDLLLQGGGFSLLVLDLGSVPPERALRIPLSTWFRFRAACERTRSALVVLTQHPCAKSSAEMVLRTRAGQMQVQNGVLTGISFKAEVERKRTRAASSNVVPIRKPPQSEREGRWNRKAAWAVRS